MGPEAGRVQQAIDAAETGQGVALDAQRIRAPLTFSESLKRGVGSDIEDTVSNPVRQLRGRVSL